MVLYSDFKKDFLNSKIRARKKELGYLTPKKNKTGKECNTCAYSDSFSPYVHRCVLISFDFGRSASINLGGCCKEFIHVDTGTRSRVLMEKYDNIEHEKIDVREVITEFRKTNWEIKA